MRVIVVHEDGDRTTRVQELAEEVRQCVKAGSMQALGVSVEVQSEGWLR